MLMGYAISKESNQPTVVALKHLDLMVDCCRMKARIGFANLDKLLCCCWNLGLISYEEVLLEKNYYEQYLMLVEPPETQAFQVP